MKEQEIEILNEVAKELSLEGKDLEDFEKMAKGHCTDGPIEARTFVRMTSSKETSQKALDALTVFQTKIAKHDREIGMSAIDIHRRSNARHLW